MRRPARPPSLAVWLLAARPRTLPASLVPIAVGTALAARDGALHAGAATAAVVTALLLQIGANLANDVFDFERGADGDDRVGPPRATQRGLVAASTMRRATVVVFLAAAISGAYLVLRGGWPIACLGLASIGAGLAYTGGPWPLGYHGLGDLLVLVFFGFAGVTGTYFVQAGATSPGAWWAALPVGLLATAILAVNNLRDIASDRRAGKRTVCVRLGPAASRRYHALLVAGAFATLTLGVALGHLPRTSLVAWLSLPLALRLVRRVHALDGERLNACLAETARLEAVFGGLLTVGLIALGLSG